MSRRRVLGAMGAMGALSAGAALGRTHVLRALDPLGVLVPGAGATPASTVVTVDPTRVVGAVPERMLGFSMERARLFQPLLSPDNGPMTALLALLGPGVLRLGGNSVEATPWAPAGPGLTTGVVAPADVARLADLVDLLGWDVLYGTPFVNGTAATVADEVHTVAALLGPRLAAVELANEPDLYAIDPTATAFAGFDAFHAHWTDLAAAVEAAPAGVTFAGPANALLQTYHGWFRRFADVEHARSPLLTQHYYRGTGLTPGSIAELLSPDPLLLDTLAKMQQTAAGYGLAFRLGETNSYSSGGQPGVSNTIASALWLQDLWFTAAQFGAAGINVHNSGAGAGYPAIAQLDGVVTEVRPLYYGLLLASRAGWGDLLSTSVTGDAPSLRARTVRRADGTLAVVVLNTSDTAITIGLDVGRTVRRALASHLVGPAGLDATTGVTFRGATVGIDGSWDPHDPEPQAVGGTSVEATVPAAGVTLLEIELATPTTSTTSTPTTTARPGATPVASPVAAAPAFTG